MPYYKILEKDILYNELRLYPKSEFFMYSGNVYYNNRADITGAHTDTITHIPSGYISLYEANVDRPSDQLIYPFRTKDGSLTSFKTISTSKLNTDFSYGNVVTASYPLSASITIKYYESGSYDLLVGADDRKYRKEVEALRSAINYNSHYNPIYAISSSIRDLTTDEINIIDIPSIFYGSSIQRGSVDLKYYVTGTMIGRAQDLHKDGNLIHTEQPTSPISGSSVGFVLYDEGFVILYNSSDSIVVNTKEMLFNGTSEYLQIFWADNLMNYLYDGGSVGIDSSVYAIFTKMQLGADAKNNKQDPMAKNAKKEDKPNWAESVGYNWKQKYAVSSVPSTINFDPYINSFTISAWIKTSDSGVNPILTLSGFSVDDEAYYVQYGLRVQSNKLRGICGENSLFSTTTVTDGNWHHVALVNYTDPTTYEKKFALYIDGQKESAVGTSGNKKVDIGLAQLLLGADRTGAETVLYYAGSMNNLTIWDTDLSSTQMEELYNDGCTKNLYHCTFKENLMYWIAMEAFETRAANSNTVKYSEIKTGPAAIAHGAHDEIEIVTISDPDTAPSLVDNTAGCQLWSMTPHTERYTGTSTEHTASWVYFGSTGSSSDRVVSSSFSLKFNGTTRTPVMTIFTYAPKGELNSSNNYTFLEYPGVFSHLEKITADVRSYSEPPNIRIKNIASSSYHLYNEPFKKIVYISEVGIFDEDKNLIATAKLANPIKKEEKDEFIFKLKLDL